MNLKLEVPQIILDRYDALVDLVENKSVDGHVPAIELAKYYGVGVDYLRGVIQTGRLPYAFAPESGRSVSYIGILPLFMFETQSGVMLPFKRIDG